MTKNKNLGWMDDLNSFQEIAEKTAFQKHDTYWQYEYGAHGGDNNPYIMSLVQVKAKEDNARLMNVRIPADLEEKLKDIAPGIPIATVLLALADLKSEELIKDDKSILIRYKEKL